MTDPNEQDADGSRQKVFFSGIPAAPPLFSSPLTGREKCPIPSPATNELSSVTVCGETGGGSSDRVQLLAEAPARQCRAPNVSVCLIAYLKKTFFAYVVCLFLPLQKKMDHFLEVASPPKGLISPEPDKNTFWRQFNFNPVAKKRAAAPQVEEVLNPNTLL